MTEQRRIYLREYVAKNREKIAAQLASWHARNRKKANADSRAYYEANRDEQNAKKRARYHATMADPVKRAALREKTRENTRRLRAKNPEKANEWARKRTKERRRTDIEYSMTQRMRSRLGDAVRKAKANKSGTTHVLMGCKPAALRVHLESLFLHGMTWENRHLWEVDHIRPCSAFNLLDPEQQRCCFHYTNLQPLWTPDNRAKFNKIVL